MTPDEKILLLAVSEGLYSLLKERLNKNGVNYVESETLGPFRHLIDVVKDRVDEIKD